MSEQASLGREERRVRALAKASGYALEKSRGHENAGTFMPGLTKKIIIPGVGHWIQQERPQQVNDILIEFLKGL